MPPIFSFLQQPPFGRMSDIAVLNKYFVQPLFIL